ncbi:hypothetical protein SAMN05444166_2687 [Singulisphaera sp. GP187]|nr:hypothetical protein SAMN05444166_2687 [Singulisphaera sp. GP187]
MYRPSHKQDIMCRIKKFANITFQKFIVLMTVQDKLPGVKRPGSSFRDPYWPKLIKRLLAKPLGPNLFRLVPVAASNQSGEG